MAEQQLLDYIKQQLKEGANKENIRSGLLQNGWTNADVDSVFSQISGQNTTLQENMNDFSVGDATKNGKAITGLVLGIIGLIAWFIPIIGAPITIIGLIFSIKGLKSLKRGVAIVGIILSSVGLFATIVNASIGAYQGVIGQNQFVNEFLNQENQETQNEISQTTQSVQQSLRTQNIILDILEKQAYSNSQYGFTINSPKDWRIDESKLFDTLITFLNTEIDQEGLNSFVANITVTSESTQGLNLVDYINETKDLLSKLLQDYKSTENRKITINGMQAQIIGGTFVEGVFNFRNIHLIIVENGQAYIVTGIALESTWDQYEDLFESSLLTFSLN